jgi:hypothetical protein
VVARSIPVHVLDYTCTMSDFQVVVIGKLSFVICSSFHLCLTACFVALGAGHNNLAKNIVKI